MVQKISFDALVILPTEASSEKTLRVFEITPIPSMQVLASHDSLNAEKKTRDKNSEDKKITATI